MIQPIPNPAFDRSRSSQSALSTWCIRLLGYDGILPAVVMFVPAIIFKLCGRGALLEVVAVVLPISAFFWRAALGSRMIATNGCHPIVRKVQSVLLFLALLLLVFIDSFSVLVWSIPGIALTRSDFVILACLYAIYLSLMAIAMFPGKAPRET